MSTQNLTYKLLFQIPVFTLLFYAVLKLVDLQISGLLQKEDYQYLMVGLFTSLVGAFISPIIVKKFASVKS
jgi:hypothetical protein